jgi:hypothetical protein
VVIGQIQDLEPSILRMEYDFHTKQPVNGKGPIWHNKLFFWR